MEVAITDLPGGRGQAYQCPNCSHSYPMEDENKAPQEPPRVCKRCGSPMDVTQGAAYSDKMAEAADQGGPGVGRRTVKV